MPNMLDCHRYLVHRTTGKRIHISNERYQWLRMQGGDKYLKTTKNLVDYRLKTLVLI
jgi:hypothetical protein